MLILAALALGIVTLLPAVRVPPPDEPSVPLLLDMVLILVFGGLTVWFAMQILRGKNWGRWAMLGYLLMGWVFVFIDFNDDLARAPLLAILNIVITTLEVAACYLLFAGAGARWFSDVSAARNAKSVGL